jgi:L-ascorbate metabolism protein UlaG (beta-lactamase superfamily)
MKLTKFEHACFTVEKDGQVVVVDPGAFTMDFVVPENVVAIVVTHEHQDHFEPAKLHAIMDKNPNAKIYAHVDVTSQMQDLPAVAVDAGEVVEIGDFKLEFFGGKHALIHPSMPIAANLGVMINDSIYHPGDSFTLPNKPVDVLALPVGAPWLKISEAIDFLNTVKPQIVFPTHDAILSEIGKGLADRIVPMLNTNATGKYQRIDGSIDI